MANLKSFNNIIYSSSDNEHYEQTLEDKIHLDLPYVSENQFLAFKVVN